MRVGGGSKGTGDRETVRVGLAGGRKHGQEANACSHEGGNSEEGETDHVSSGEVLELLNFLHSFRVWSFLKG